MLGIWLHAVADKFKYHMILTIFIDHVCLSYICCFKFASGVAIVAGHVDLKPLRDDPAWAS